MRPTFVATLVKCDIIFLNKVKMVEIYEGKLSGMYYARIWIICKQSCVEKASELE